MALPIFAITLFISAFLLFLVQPMIAKMILPNLGGTPQVWNTCMVFFQSVLLAGYAYTHSVSTRLKLRTQLLVHGIVLLLPMALIVGSLFYAQATQGSFHEGTFRGITKDWIPPAGGNPVLATLLLLTIVVGLPFFVVSTSAPLLQKWFSYSGHATADDPYFLYGASNLGSMLSLILYPFFVEALLPLYSQSWTWIGGYALLVVFFFICVGLVWQAPASVKLPDKKEPADDEKESVESETESAKKKPESSTAVKAGSPKKDTMRSRIRKGSKQRRKKPIPQPKPVRPIGRGKPVARQIEYEEVRSDDMSLWRRLRWILLAFVPSSLMLGITTYVSTDVSAIPLFWVVPLTLYLASFILVFAKWPVIWTREPHTLMVIAHPAVMMCLIFVILIHLITPIYPSLTFAVLAFFLTTMVCHGELARDRPSTKHLTEFYLMMSVGGMLGGVFNALLAPILFKIGPIELPIALALACMVRPYTHRLKPVEQVPLIVFCGIVGAICLGFLNVFPIYVGLVLGFILGVLAGAVYTFDARNDGWTEKLLFSIFPGLSEWTDKKGREIKEEMSKSKSKTVDSEADEPEERPRRQIVPVGPPNHYLLNYALDIALPVAVALVVFLVHYNSDDVGKWVQEFGKNTLALKTNQEAYQLEKKDRPMLTLEPFVVQSRRFLQYGIPLLCALFFAFRPLRMGLLIAFVFLITTSFSEQAEGRSVLHRDRSYFGILRVIMREDRFVVGFAPKESPQMFDGHLETETTGAAFGTTGHYTSLLHGTTHHGLNYHSPKGLRRLATTYYHRKGPVGAILEKLNWFPGAQNTYLADVRMPTALVGMGYQPMAFGFVPDVQLVNLWSEPPFATIGLGTGTMASYTRPFQHMTFYEIDKKIQTYSLGSFPLRPELFHGDDPKNDQWREGPFYNYLHDAIKRGAYIEMVMGDARISLKGRTERIREKKRREGEYEDWKKWREGIAFQEREHYYHAMEIDAFSSDAIPVHLITKEAIQTYLKKLAPEGVILVHTSNRHLNLVDPVADIAKELGLACMVAKDNGPQYQFGNHRGHFGSEYVMLGRSFEAIAKMTGQDPQAVKKAAQKRWADRVLRQLFDLKLPQKESEYWSMVEAIKSNGISEDQMKEVTKNTGMPRHRAEFLLHVWLRDTTVPNKTPRSVRVKWATGADDAPSLIWYPPRPPGNWVWTDDYSNLAWVMRWGLWREGIDEDSPVIAE